MKISADDKLIWSLNTGALLRAAKDLVMADDGERAFTAGVAYRVKSMHPIANPAYVILVNDQGHDHKLYGEHVRQYFGDCTKTPN